MANMHIQTHADQQALGKDKSGTNMRKDWLPQGDVQIEESLPEKTEA